MALGVLLLLAILVHGVLPLVAKRLINRRLASLPEYTGHIDGVRISVLRLAVAIDGIVLRQREDHASLAVRSAWVDVDGWALLRRHLIASALLDQPRLRITGATPARAVSPSSKDAQKGRGAEKKPPTQDAGQSVRRTMPFRIDRFEVRDGSVRLRAPGGTSENKAREDLSRDTGAGADDQAESARDVRVTDLEIVVENLTNSQRLSDSLLARARVSAKLMGKSPLVLNAHLNPTARQPTFEADLRVEEFALAQLNPLLRWQLGIDVEKGTFAMFAEAAAAEGRFEGYVKPLIRDLDVLDLAKDKAHPLKVVKEAVVGTIATVFSNRKEDQLGTRIPFKGRFENPEIGIWAAIGSVFRNAFIEALRPRLDRTVSLRALERGGRDGSGRR